MAGEVAATPTSECFCSWDLSTEERCALQHALVFAFNAYIDLTRQGVFSNDFALSSYTHAQRVAAGQPEQDPLGTLTATMMAIRRRPPTGDHIKKNCTGGAALSWEYRRWMAAVMTVSHKMATSCPSRVKRSTELIVCRFMLAHEELAWCTRGSTSRLLQVQQSMEAVVAMTDVVLRTLEDGPLAHFEAAATRLLATDALTKDALITLRGTAFFFLACAFLDGEESVLEDLNTWVSSKDIGLGLLNACLACGGVALETRVGLRQNFGASADAAARVLLEGACLPIADTLRIGAYSMGDNTAHVSTCSAMVSKYVVRAALQLFDESEI